MVDIIKNINGTPTEKTEKAMNRRKTEKLNL
jgi:hypothetical protein